MQEVFEKIIEKLECEYEDIKEIYKRTKDMSFYFTFQGVNKAIEIVKKESEKRYHGHFGCNTNGEHEKCNGCGLTDCKNRNKIWFGVSDDNNGWILCSERMPEVPEGIDDDECPEFIVTIKGANKATTLKCASDGTWFDEFGNIYDAIAWQKLPQPYQPKGE